MLMSYQLKISLVMFTIEAKESSASLSLEVMGQPEVHYAGIGTAEILKDTE